MPINDLTDIETLALELAAAAHGMKVPEVLNCAVRDYLDRYKTGGEEGAFTIIDTLARSSDQELKEAISRVLRSWKPADPEGRLRDDWSVEFELAQVFGTRRTGELIDSLTDAIVQEITNRDGTERG